jgi:hypothetical protein
MRRYLTRGKPPKPLAASPLSSIPVTASDLMHRPTWRDIHDVDWDEPFRWE